jgi:hypothetical protein
MGKDIYKAPSENWQTRLNYSLIAKGIFAGVAFETASYVLPGTNLRQIIDPELSRNLLKGASYAGYIGQAGVGTMSLGFKSWENKSYLSVFGAPVREVVEQIGKTQEDSNYVPSMQQIQDISMGGLMWLGFDVLAKGLHDSGITYPIYKMLRIKHRLIDQAY